MPNYIRTYLPGGTYFFTVVVRDRRPVLARADVRAALHQAVRVVRARWPFAIDAWVLLPNHLHCLWTLTEADADFSRRWSTIKRLTTQGLGHSIWQPRFWEHLIRDERDFERHFDYIHWNPVKHGHVRAAAQWPYSTFHRYVEREIYPPDWADQGPDIDLE